MSRENVEVIQRATEAFNRGDLSGWSESMAPDVVFYQLEGVLDTPPEMRGREACMEMMSEFTEMFDNFKADIEDLIDAGDWVITVVRWQGSGAGSGASADMREVIAWKIEAGVVIEGRVFADTKEALEAAGLRE